MLEYVIIYSIPRHVYVESGSLLFANAVEVRLFKVGPESLMLVAVPGEVEHTVETKVWSVPLESPEGHLRVTASADPSPGKTNLGSSSKQY